MRSRGVGRVADQATTKAVADARPKITRPSMLPARPWRSATKAAPSPPSAKRTPKRGNFRVLAMIPGKAVKARKSAKARWIERAWVSLKIRKPSIKGRGEAYHIWKRDQASATA